MPNNLMPLDRGPSKLVQNRRSSLNANAQAGVMPSFAVLGYKGKNWRLKFRSEETVLRDDRKQPLTSVEVVIVGVSPNISRQFFMNSYTDGASEGPDCFSSDGVKPDAAAPHKQNATCGTCPRGQWGSRITEGGKRAKECQDTRRLAVVPLSDIENTMFGGPMLLRVPPMSINNLSQYTQFLDRKGASVETVATRIGFDVEMAYPRLTFEALGYLNDDQQRQVIGDDGNSGVCADPLIGRMLASSEEAAAPARASDAPKEPEQYGPPAPQQEPEEEQEEAPPEEEEPPAPTNVRTLPSFGGGSAGALAGGAAGQPKKPAAAKPAARRNGPVIPSALASEAEMESALDDLLGDNTTA